MDAVKDRLYDQLRAMPAITQTIHTSSHMVVVMATEAGQTQVTKRYMVTSGMTSQSQILRARGSWNMHWLMICSSVTCASRNASHLITDRSGNRVCVISKGHVTDVTVIYVKEVALVSDMLIDMLSQSLPLSVQKCRYDKSPTDWKQSFIFYNCRENGDAQGGDDIQQGVSFMIPIKLCPRKSTTDATAVVLQMQEKSLIVNKYILWPFWT